MSAMVASSDDQIEVVANLKYENKFINLVHFSRINYAICDSGAESCVVGKIAKIESVTMRTTYLVGYDPQTTIHLFYQLYYTIKDCINR